jgi:hypothetical protein
MDLALVCYYCGSPLEVFSAVAQGTAWTNPRILYSNRSTLGLLCPGDVGWFDNISIDKSTSPLARRSAPCCLKAYCQWANLGFFIALWVFF